MFALRRVSGLHVDYLRTEEEDGKNKKEKKKSRDISVTTLMIQPYGGSLHTSHLVRRVVSKVPYLGYVLNQLIYSIQRLSNRFHYFRYIPFVRTSLV